MARKSPEEKAAKRRAAFEKRVALTTSREAERKATAERAIERENAFHAAAVATKVTRLSEQGRPFTFTALGISVLDGVVYVMDRGNLRQLGSLAGATAHVTRLPSRQVHRSAGTQLVFGVTAVRKVERAEIFVSASGATHLRVIEERFAGDGPIKRAQREARDFNELARQAHPSLISRAGASLAQSRPYTAGALRKQLQQIRAAVADASQSHERVRLHMEALARQQNKLEWTAGEARQAGREDLVQQAMTRSDALGKQISELKTAFDALQKDEEELIAMAGRLQSRIDALPSGQ